MKKRMLSSIALAALLSVGVYAFAAPTPTAQAAPAASHAIVMRSSGTTATADFAVTEGDVSISMFLAVSTNLSPDIPGPGVGMSIGETNTATGASFVAEGNAPVQGLQIDTKNLGSAVLPDTAVPVTPIDLSTGEPVGPSFIVHVSASWTATSPITVSVGTSHFRVPHLYNVTVHGTDKQRDATAESNFSYTSPLSGEPVSVTGATSEFANIYSSRVTIVMVEH